HVPQERSLFPLMSVWENMLLGGHSLRARGVARRRAEELAERFPLLRERRNERAGSLSGGQQKLVEIARALMLRPKLVLMDERAKALPVSTSSYQGRRDSDRAAHIPLRDRGSSDDTSCGRHGGGGRRVRPLRPPPVPWLPPDPDSVGAGRRVLAADAADEDF